MNNPDKPVTVTEKRDLPRPGESSGPAADNAASGKVVERPVVVSLGSTRRKRIKELKRGTGKLMYKVRNAVELVAADLGQDAEGRKLLPVVVVYREKFPAKRRRRGGQQGMCPLCCV